MTVLNTITIKARLILSFVLIVLLFIGFEWISMNQLETVGDLTSTLYNHPLQVSTAALRAETGIISMHRSMKDVSTSTTQLDITLAIQNVQSEEKKVYQAFSTIQSLILGEQGQKLIKETMVLFAEWRPIRREVETLVLEGKNSAANKITREKGANHVARLERKMRTLAAYALNKADGFMMDAKKVETQIFRQALVFTGIFILMVLGIGFFLASSILSSVSSLKGTMNKITQTGELTKARVWGNNEITRMAEDFNRLIERLKAQFWLSKGLNTLNQKVSGELTHDQILARSMDYTSRYVDACAGALYLHDEAKGVCELKAAYAFTEGKHFPKQFKPGEGIVGQVAAEGKSILLKNITRQEAMGQSGTMGEPPVGIYVLPLVYEKILYGVLEIGSFEEITGIKQDFLNAAAHIISTGLHTSAQNLQIKSLLEISQEANGKLQDQAAKLQAQTEELQAMNEEFQQQSDELKEQNIELEAQQQQVVEANRLKSEFLSNMSHELRTPLNSVNALSRVLILQAREKLSKEEVNFLEIIERNGKHLLSLINDILDLSKIESGKMDIRLTHFSVATLIENIMESIGPIAREKNLSLTRQFAADLPKIESDESRVFQIVQNIIANAVKFTDSGQVSISAGREEEQVYIKVKDTGIGISDAEVVNIFDEFRQVDGASTRKFEGTGLGLAIALKAVRMLGGNIRVKSTQGLGSEFTITLPVVYDGPKKILDLLETHITPFSAGKPDIKDIKTLLIVDDDPRVLEKISRVCSDSGYLTLTATSGKEAIRLAREYQPFAITLDVMMPEMDGWEVLSLLKKNPTTSHIPVIIVSVSDDKDTGFALGAAGYVTKPVIKETLLSEIHKIYGYLPSTVMVVDDSDMDRQQTGQIITAEGMKILLVEDNEAAVIQVKKILETMALSVDVARDGQQAMDYIQQTIPAGIILDLMMPNMDGFQLLEALRGTLRTKDLPVLILTAKDLTSADLQRLSANNVRQLIQKGDVDREELLNKVSRMLNQIPEPSGVKELPAPASAAPSGPNRETPIILLVEDNPDNMTTIKAVIGKGYATREAFDGRQGIERAIEELPDLIFLDMSLPKVDGLTVVRELKQNKRTRHIPVIALTAQAMKGDREKMIQSGCDDYVAKPIDPEIIAKKLEKWLPKNG